MQLAGVVSAASTAGALAGNGTTAICVAGAVAGVGVGPDATRATGFAHPEAIARPTTAISIHRRK
jgi:hypothetical protein